MPQGANVDSIELLKDFQGILWKFKEASTGALDDVESELRRAAVWLDVEQDSYWKGQIRLRHEILERAKEALRSKRIYKDASGHQQSVVEEQKAMKIATARMQEAEEKLANVRKWVRALQKEIELYKGSVARLANSVESLIPGAVHHLDRLMVSLEAYLHMAPPEGISDASSSDAAGAGFANRDGQIFAPPSDAATAANDAEFPAPDLPTPDQLAHAPLDVSPCVSLPLISDAQFEALRALVGGAPPMDRAHTLAFNLEPQHTGEFIMQRLAPTAADESGWCIIADAGGPWRRARIDSLAGEVAQWDTLLQLPMGFRVVVGEGKITAVLDGSAKNVLQDR